jgi:hypothetical protein
MRPRRRLAGRIPRKKALGGLLLVGLVVVASVLTYLRFAMRPTAVTRPSIPTSLTIDVQEGAVSCPSALAWSPDGTRLAVLAQRGGCDAGAPDTILVYDAISGAHRATLDLSGALTQAQANIFLPTPALSWSPDGTWIAAPVGLPGTTSAGLLLIPVNGGAPQVLRPAATTPSGGVAIWNIQSGQPTGSLAQPLAPAVSYRWTADGQITIGQPFPPAGSTNFTGSPVTQPGSATFPLWQSGAIISIYPTPPTPRKGVLPAYYFVAQGGFWSPQEGQARYMIPSLTLGPWPLPGTPDTLRQVTPAGCSGFGWLPPCGAAVLPMPDRAFAQVAQRVTSLSSSDLTTLVQGNLLVPLAWRPDGKVLSVMLPGDSFSPAHDTVKVSLLSTTTGQTVGSVTLQTHTSALLNPLPPPLFWSPSGLQLAFMDSTASRVTIWGGTSLPHA